MAANPVEASAPASPVIDFRSDTLTLPTAAMTAAMNAAALGDDVFGEDPSIAQLEAHVASVAGKASALFVPSGTMSNLIAVMLHGEGLCSEIIVGDASHIACYEVGGASGVGRVMLRQVETATDGTLPLAALKRAIQASNIHHSVTRAIALENTHNSRGGRVLPVAYLREVKALCDAHHLALHCDGARLWNAAVALQVPLAALTAPFDTVSLCLSKGLGAPVGSVLVGSEPFIARARQVRKMLGGGMRQGGMLAAAGMFAIQQQFQRLRDDHEMAAQLHRRLQEELKFASAAPPESNIVIWSVGTSARRAVFLERCRAAGLLLVPMGPEGDVRAVPHLGNTPDDVERAVSIIRQVEAQLAAEAI